LVCSTNEGLYANCSRDKTSRFTFLKRYSNKIEKFECDFDCDYLLSEAEKGEFFSYIAGTIIALLERDRIRDKLSSYGIIIDNHTSTLPMKKGLSSSAAVCVLIATSFNLIYNLNLSMQDIMEIAYQGEMKTPSKCGRMDQCVAMGSGSIALMKFNKRQPCELQVLECRTTLYFVVADLNAGKNTVTILSSLSSCFPSPASHQEVMSLQTLEPLRRDTL